MLGTYKKREMFETSSSFLADMFQIEDKSISIGSFTHIGIE